MELIQSHKKLVTLFLALVVTIPSSSILLSQRIQQSVNNQPYDRTVSTINEVPGTSPLKDLLKNLNSSPTPTPSPATSSGTLDSFGPTLQLQISIQGRPNSDQHTKLFVGVAQGTLSTNPQYLLSFNVDVPNSGIYNDISLVGLTQGETYTAYLKGSATLVTAVSFIMSPQGVKLNSGAPITLISGDLNEDNVIDQADVDILMAALGTTPTSSKWNQNLDLNKDGVINSLDLAIVNKNLGKVGDGGKWYSTTPSATKSATLQVPGNIGGISAGYWMWVPGTGN